MSFLSISYYLISTLSHSFFKPIAHANTFHLTFRVTGVVSVGIVKYGNIKHLLRNKNSYSLPSTKTILHTLSLAIKGLLFLST